MNSAITIPLPPRAMHDIEMLQHIGLFGVTAEDVARYLITRGLDDLVRSGVIPGMLETASATAPAKDWFTDEALKIIELQLKKGWKWRQIYKGLGLNQNQVTLVNFKYRCRKIGLSLLISDKQAAHLVAIRAKNPRLHPELRRAA